MTESGVLFIGLTAIVAGLAGVLAFAATKFIVAARAVGKERGPGAETAFMAAAMEQAVKGLREQERAMKARAEASERLSEEIIASITSGLMVVTGERRVRTLNPAGRRILGLPDPPALPHPSDRSDRSDPSDPSDRSDPSDPSHPPDPPMSTLLRTAPPLVAVIEECLASGKPVLRRAVQMGYPGAAIHLGVTVSPIRDDDGRAQGAICLFTDLSAVVELEEQLRLKDSLARLGELTAGIAHEFRNGLATIHGYGRLLDLSRLPEDFRPYVQGIREETEALRQVVINFLNFAKPTELAVTPVRLRGIAERAIEEIRGEVATRGGEVRVTGDFGTVLGDEVLLRQAFSNLCRNALEACVDQNVPPRISIAGTIDAGQRTQVMTVTDNGPGVDASVTARMFRPFFTTKKTGTGLGLALVQKIIVTHNGKVTAANADGAGARILVMLPLQPD